MPGNQRTENELIVEIEGYGMAESLRSETDQAKEQDEDVETLSFRYVLASNAHQFITVGHQAHEYKLIIGPSLWEKIWAVQQLRNLI